MKLINKYILGTVQFGLNYGVNNQLGKPSEDKVFQILDEAFKQNIHLLDTAEAYGNAVDIIGQYHKSGKNQFKVLSKFKDVTKGLLSDQISKNLDLLNIDSFEVYSYHSYSDFWEKKYLLDELEKAKQNGSIKKIGISLYTNTEMESAIQCKSIDVIQIPYSLLDNKNQRGELIKFAKEKKKEVHVRSIFLQGLFFKGVETLPQNLLQLKPYLELIDQICQDNNVSKLSLASSYAYYNEDIDNVLIGVDSLEQLKANIQSLDFNQEAFEKVNRYLKVKETHLLNPVNW